MKKRIIIGAVLASFALITVSAAKFLVMPPAVTAQDDRSLLRKEIDKLERELDKKMNRIAELSSKTSLSAQETKELANCREDVKNIQECIYDLKAQIKGVPERVYDAELPPGTPAELLMTKELTGAVAVDEASETPAEMAVPAGVAVPEGTDIPMADFTLQVGSGKKVFHVADVNDEAHVYGKAANKKNTWIVISKKEFRVYVYEKVNEDVLLRATFPICYARNAQDKTRTGDSCTPECRDANTPFTISEIKDASSWRHTFANDPRGNILAYGPYFMRLRLTGHPKVAGNNSIGIHGCGGYDGKSNSYSVPGRDSEGCIRLRDNDLRTLRTDYCEVGTKVYIKPATGKAGDKYDYEQAAVKALGSKYVPATMGNPLAGTTKTL